MMDEKNIEEKISEEIKEERNDEQEGKKDNGRVLSRRCHARMSIMSRQQQKVDADVYMARNSIGEILQWITLEILTARPTNPIKFMRELLNNESLDLDSIRGVNNTGITILRNSLSRENETLRATVRCFLFHHHH